MNTLLEEGVPQWESRFEQIRSRKNPKSSSTNTRYAAIEKALRSIADSKPKAHHEVFNALERRVAIPFAKPFTPVARLGRWLPI